MASTLNQPGSHAKDSSQPYEGSISPLSYVEQIGALALIGAPALRCAPYGLPSEEEIVMPLTQPLPLGPALPDEPWDWLSRRLRAYVTVQFPRSGGALSATAIKRLCAMLAPGPRRWGGLPCYWPAPPRAERAWAGSQRVGSIGRAVLTAAAADLGEADLNQISVALLGLHDHQIIGRDTVREDGDPRRARMYQQEGRRLLAHLGCWPWAHAPEGRLPSGWRDSADYLAPLREWHQMVTDGWENECERARAAFRQVSGDGLSV
jgi:hypothetical protein